MAQARPCHRLRPAAAVSLASSVRHALVEVDCRSKAGRCSRPDIKNGGGCPLAKAFTMFATGLWTDAEFSARSETGRPTAQLRSRCGALTRSHSGFSKNAGLQRVVQM